MRDAFQAAPQRRQLRVPRSWRRRVASAYQNVRRTIVKYRDAAADPVANPARKTVRFADLVPARPECELLGLGYQGGLRSPNDSPRSYVVSYFDTTKINVLNRARGGRSSRTFFTEGLWDKVLEEMKVGDFVLIQFGHNDGGPLNTDRARGSLPGVGEETREVVMPNGNSEVVHTYGWYMKRFVEDAKAKGTTTIVLSLTVRNIWKDGKVERGSGKYGEWAAEIAKSQSVAFVDLTTIVADQYEKLGQERVKELFATDHTHTSPIGAELNAASVVAGLKALKNDPLKRYLSQKAKAVR